METLETLVDRVDPAWPLVTKWLSEARADVVLIERHQASSEATLLHLQTSTHSLLGALAYECGGLVVSSMVRVLGGGTPEVRASLRTWNGRATDSFPVQRGLVRVGFDVFGGVFALDGGALGKGDGQVHYFAPERLAWESLNLGHTAWVHWLLTEPDKVLQFYQDFAWPDRARELPLLEFDMALHLHPPPWSAEGQDLARVSRRPTSAVEVVKGLFEAMKQLN